MSEPTEQRAALLRQRRFMILTSIAVVAYYWLGASPKGELEIGGFGLKFAKHGNLIVMLWAAWVWSVLRYWQRTYELWSVLRDELTEDVFAEDMRIALKRAKRTGNELAAEGKIDADLPTSARVDGAVKVDPPEPDELHADTVLGIKTQYFRGYTTTKVGGRKYRLKADFYWEQGVKWGRGDQTFTMELTQWQAARLRFRAWILALFNLPAFSEHYAPFLIAIPAMVIGVRELGAWLLPDCSH